MISTNMTQKNVKNKKKLFVTDDLYHQLGYDWDGVVNLLHGEDLFDTPNHHSRLIRNMVVVECLRIVERVRKLPWWRRLFNCF